MRTEYTKWLCYKCSRAYYTKGHCESMKNEDYTEVYECESCHAKTSFVNRFTLILDPEVNFEWKGGYAHKVDYWVRIDGKYIYGSSDWSRDPLRLEYVTRMPQTLEALKVERFNVHNEADAHYNFIDWENTIHWAQNKVPVNDIVFEAAKIFFNPNVRRARFCSEWMEVGPDEDFSILIDGKPVIQTNMRVEYY